MAELIFCIAATVVLIFIVLGLYFSIREWALDRAMRKRKEREKK